MDVDQLELCLEISRSLGGKRDVAAGRWSISKRRRQASVTEDAGDRRACRCDVRGRPVVAHAGELDGARREVRCDFRAGGHEVVDDALPVDADGDRLAHCRVVPRRVVVVHAQVERVQTWLWLELQVWIGVNGCEVGGSDKRHAVDCSCLEGLEARSGLCGELEDARRRDCLHSPVAVKAAVVDLSAALPRVELERTSAVQSVDLRVVGGVSDEPVAVVDREH